jgi:hypothetical protein
VERQVDDRGIDSEEEAIDAGHRLAISSWNGFMVSHLFDVSNWRCNQNSAWSLAAKLR